MVCLLVGFLISVLFSITDGSGQSCVDLDPQGCLDMAKQNPNMCMDHDLATAVCPQLCHRCPITSYNCNSPSRDVLGCNTITCNNGETCDARQAAGTKCCSDDLCNTPDLIPHVTLSTLSHSTSSTGSASSAGYCWIGLTDMDVEGVWVWYDTEQKPTYTYWYPGEPGGAYTEDCGVYTAHHSDYKWDDYPCNSLFHPICEHSVNDEGGIIG